MEPPLSTPGYMIIFHTFAQGKIMNVQKKKKYYLTNERMKIIPEKL